MAKCGRPRNDSVQDFSVHETPEEGLYLVRFKVGGNAFCATVRYRVRMGVAKDAEQRPRSKARRGFEALHLHQSSEVRPVVGR